MGRPTPAAIRKRARRVRCLFLDIDGVLTDGRLYIGADGAEFKTNYVRDGYGIKRLLAHGVDVAVISGRPSEAMRQRLSFLGVKHVVLDREDKLPAYEQIRDRLGLADADCAVMGDDAPDLPVMARAGLALAPADAHACALRAAHWVSRHPGGLGAVRDAADMILTAQGRD